jgi:hypothetical protein
MHWLEGMVEFHGLSQVLDIVILAAAKLFIVVSVACHAFRLVAKLTRDALLEIQKLAVDIRSTPLFNAGSRPRSRPEIIRRRPVAECTCDLPASDVHEGDALARLHRTLHKRQIRRSSAENRRPPPDLRRAV